MYNLVIALLAVQMRFEHLHSNRPLVDSTCLRPIRYKSQIIIGKWVFISLFKVVGSLLEWLVSVDSNYVDHEASHW